VEKRYQKELQQYNEMLQGGKPEAEQMYLFAEEEPTPEKIFQEKVAHLKTDIVKKCKGRTLTRLNIPRDAQRAANP
jgi:hypothetical protein